MDNKSQPKATGGVTGARVASPKTTIVGGQPAKQARWKPPRVPVGVERVLILAATDPNFNELLFRDREVALAGLEGIRLEASEEAMLRYISEGQLRASIRGLDTSRDNLQRRSFLRAVAVGVITLAAGDAAMGCSDDTGKVPPPDVGITMDGATTDLWGPDGKVQPPDVGITLDGVTRDRGPDKKVQPPDVGITLDGVTPDMTPPDSKVQPPDVIISVDGATTDK